MLYLFLSNVLTFVVHLLDFSLDQRNLHYIFALQFDSEDHRHS